jgi:ABC-2 type transport system permease protein
MIQLWRVAKFEYTRNVFKKSFFFVILSVPFLVAFSIGTGLFMESLDDNPQPVGYIDQAGVLAGPESGRTGVGSQDQQSGFIPFSDADTARAALEGGQIQAYYLLPADYLQTRQVDVVYIKRPKDDIWRRFYDFLQIGLLTGRQPEVAQRLAEGSQIIVRSVDGSRQVSRASPSFGLLMPLFVTMAFLFLLMISSGYMMGAVSEEKENRTIEVLVTSVSTAKLMASKVLGIVGTSLTLLLAWTVVLVAGIVLAAQAGISWFSNLTLDWSSILASLAVAIPAYVLAAALMIAIGAMVTSSQEAQSVSAVFFILHLLPLYTGWIFLNSPNHPLGVLLSLLPFTALMTLGFRNLFIIVPAWQVIASVIVQAACAVGAVWLAGRALRLGMLRYGQRLNWRALFGIGVDHA